MHVPMCVIPLAMLSRTCVYLIYSVRLSPSSFLLSSSPNKSWLTNSGQEQWLSTEKLSPLLDRILQSGWPTQVVPAWGGWQGWTAHASWILKQPRPLNWKRMPGWYRVENISKSVLLLVGKERGMWGEGWGEEGTKGAKTHITRKFGLLTFSSPSWFIGRPPELHAKLARMFSKWIGYLNTSELKWHSWSERLVTEAACVCSHADALWKGCLLWAHLTSPTTSWKPADAQREHGLGLCLYSETSL